MKHIVFGITLVKNYIIYTIGNMRLLQNDWLIGHRATASLFVHKKTAEILRSGFSAAFLRTLIKGLVPFWFLCCFHFNEMASGSSVLYFCVQLIDVISKTQ